jgi:hypothetical protein
MNANKQLSKWIVDAGLWIGFLVAFFLDLTGVDVHQWLGIALAGLAGYHLITHWNWVKVVTARFFGRTSAQARLYYLIDAGLLFGFGMITITGLVISTWFDLALDNYAVWKDVHVFSSVATLSAAVVKIGLHWRWIVNVARQAFQGSKVPAISLNPGQPSPAGMTRRHFLSLMSVVGLASWAAVQNVVSEEDSVKAEGLTENAQTTTSKSKVLAAAPIATQTASTTTKTTCTVRCNKRCAYPGRCRRYVDTNNNKKCDLGECV